ncbi:hypothetical protein H9Y04_03205 [Streptomyces sp. TRM66268-LWL]|uniref:Integral membrane protein n=1 Tax=Streptomyces polyasparticus TaxID=2767826 RepID=A0ABR7S7Y1_9ACTN|nr:hypothetical protein [Streptomyces polyasparticus]MBC9711577.1 hypothetical protein [Streptomyces polyasparticus]
MIRRLGCVLAPLLGALAALCGVALVSRMWAACDVGVGAGANAGALLLLAVPLFLVTSAGSALTVAAVGRRSGALALAGSVAVTLLAIWLFVALLHSPGDYPAPVCAPDNLPPWWPGWLPV